MKNCPFYGHALTPGEPFALFDSRGNQCALVTGSHAPCSMETRGERPDWPTCPRVALITWPKREP